MKGYIYIIKLREHIKSKEKIFKVGRTQNIRIRLCQYPKGSVLLYTIYTEDIIEKEKIILNELSTKIRKDLGLEYFECELSYIKNIIDNNILLLDCEDFINKEIKEVINTESEKNINTVLKQDKEIETKNKKNKLIENIKKFYEDKILHDEIKEYKLYDIHREYNNWDNQENNVTVYILSKILKDLGGKVENKRFGLEVTKVINFNHLYSKKVVEKIKEIEEKKSIKINIDENLKNWIIENYEITNNIKDRVKSKDLLNMYIFETKNTLSPNRLKHNLELIGIKYHRGNGKTEYKGLVKKCNSAIDSL